MRALNIQAKTLKLGGIQRAKNSTWYQSLESFRSEKGSFKFEKNLSADKKKKTSKLPSAISQTMNQNYLQIPKDWLLRGRQIWGFIDLRFSVGWKVMATSIRVGDRLAGAKNFSPWKERMMLLFEELEG